MSWLWSLILEWIRGWISYLLDPVAWVEFGMDIANQVLGYVAYILPTEMSEKLDAFGAFINGVPLQDLASVWLFFLWPVVDGNILMVCVAFTLNVWFSAVSVKGLFWLKGHIWSGSN